MSWDDSDNKKERGKIDRIYVSKTEHYEIRYYIDSYLKDNNYNVDDSNRKIVRDAIDLYQGKPPIFREQLNTFLNKIFAERKAKNR